MASIVAVCNQKGGVGKTTLTINLGAALADLGQRVLLIDLDPQGHLTEGVGFQDFYLKDKLTLYQCLVGNKDVRFEDLIHKNPREPFYVVPSSYQLMLAEQALYMARNREHKLKGLLSQIETNFDWILIDCPPFLGNLTDNSINAARQVIIPVHAEPASVRAVELLFDQIESIEKGLNIRVKVLAVIPNEVQDSAMAKRILTELRQAIPVVPPFELRKRVLLQEAWSKGYSIFAYPADSKVQNQTRNEIVDSYRVLAKFVIEAHERS